MGVTVRRPIISPSVVPGQRIVGMVPCGGGGGGGTRIAGSTARGCNITFCRESLSLSAVLPDVPPARPPGAICSGGGCDELGSHTGRRFLRRRWLRVPRNGNAGRRHAGQQAKYPKYQ